jgi:hypothetical protein
MAGEGEFPIFPVEPGIFRFSPDPRPLGRKNVEANQMVDRKFPLRVEPGIRGAEPGIKCAEPGITGITREPHHSAHRNQIKEV